MISTIYLTQNEIRMVIEAAKEVFGKDVGIWLRLMLYIEPPSEINAIDTTKLDTFLSNIESIVGIKIGCAFRPPNSKDRIALIVEKFGH